MSRWNTWKILSEPDISKVRNGCLLHIGVQFFDLRYFLYSKAADEYLIGKYLKNDLDGVQCSGKTSMTKENTFLFWCAPEEDRNPILQILYLKK